IVKGVIAPVCDVTVRTPPVDFSAAICAPSSAPAPWMTPVTRAFCREVLSLKSMIVTESTYGRPGFQELGFLTNTLRWPGVKLWYLNGPVPFGLFGLKPVGTTYR